MDEREDNTIYKVVVNQEKQYSIWPAENMKSWQKVKQLLGEIRDICDSLHSQLILVIFPASIQVNDSHFGFYKRLTFNLNERTAESTKPQTLLMEFCAARKVSCLDLLPTFGARKNKEFYRAKDDQLNEKGNYVASQSIREFLLRNALLMAQRRVEG